MNDDNDDKRVGRDDANGNEVRQPLTPTTDDPIRYLEEGANSNIVRVWRFAAHRHGVYRIGEQSVVDGRFRSRSNFDSSWECDECHPYKEWNEGLRIKAAFDEREMWVSVIDAGDRERAVRTAGDRGVEYVALPVFMGGEVALLTTEPCFEPGDGSQLVVWHDGLVEKGLMPLRWSGSLSSSRGFLPPARVYRLWEAYHPDTRRRCWHAHDTKAKAKQCAVETGELLDGTSKGWYVRGCSEWRMMGRIGVTGSRLRELLNESAIPSWDRPIVDKRTGSDRVYVEFGPILWDDPRFVMLREAAQWTTPPGFRPPPFMLTVRVDVVSGRLTGTS